MYWWIKKICCGKTSPTNPVAYNFYVILCWDELITPVCTCMIPEGDLSWGDEVLLPFWVGVCRPNLRILTLFQTWKINFLFPISEQTTEYDTLTISEWDFFEGIFISLVHTSDGERSGDGDGSTKFHTNPVKWRRNRRIETLPFSSVPSPFYTVCMKFRASVFRFVSTSVSIASVNQATVYRLPMSGNFEICLGGTYGGRIF